MAAWMASPMPGASSTTVVSAVRRHLDLGLADARRSPPGRRRSRPRPAPASPAASPRPGRRGGRGWPSSGCRRPGRGVVLHPDPVAEQRAAGERRRRVDGQHADPLAARRGRPPTSAEVVVDLPTPGAPVRPTTVARPPYGARAAITSRSSGEASSTSEISRATARASPSRAPRDQRADVRRRSHRSVSCGWPGRAGPGRRPGRRRRTAPPRRRRRRGAAAPARGAARSGRRTCRSGGRARWRRR